MTKTKRKLRAEAVERLKNTRMDSGSAVKKLALALGSEWNPPSVNYSLGCLKKRLIDLLTDDDPMQSEFVNCGNPYREGDAVLDAAVIRPTSELPEGGDLQRQIAEQRRTIARLKADYEGKCGECDELAAKLAEYDQTHMELPLDADGVLIHMGDVVAAQDEQPFEVRAFQLDGLGWFAIERLGSQWNVNQLHHVKSRTIEDVLSEFAAAQHGITQEENDELLAAAARELREIMLEDGR